MLTPRLQAREREGRPIRIGVIGAGTFGTQIIAQVSRMQGMRVTAVADLSADRARRALRLGGEAERDVVSAGEPSAIDRAAEQDRPAITSSAEALIHSCVEIVVEATGNVECGARHAAAAIAAGKHVVMVTVEADVVVGYRLRQMAERAGVHYSLAYGDEPALAVELVDWAQALGFRVIAAGKGTRFVPAFRHANPDDVPRLYGFTGKDYNAQMFGSFLDGTKHAIEMAALANAAGLRVDCRGMHFPAVDLREMPDVLATRDRGGILAREGVVEAVSAMRPDGTYVERNLRGGMYCVFDAADPYYVESLAGYGEIVGMIVGQRSRQAMIYRPQHFIGHEVPIGLARLALDGLTCGAPVHRMADVVAAAKKPLRPGDVLDGEGGYTVYGLLENSAVVRRDGLVPIGLTQGATVLREIPQDGLLTWNDVAPRESYALDLRREQDAGEPMPQLAASTV